MKVGKFQNADDAAMSEKLIRAEFPYSAGYRFFPAGYKHEPSFRQTSCGLCGSMYYLDLADFRESQTLR